MRLQPVQARYADIGDKARIQPEKAHAAEGLQSHRPVCGSGGKDKSLSFRRPRRHAYIFSQREKACFFPPVAGRKGFCQRTGLSDAHAADERRPYPAQMLHSRAKLGVGFAGGEHYLAESGAHRAVRIQIQAVQRVFERGEAALFKRRLNINLTLGHCLQYSEKLPFVHGCAIARSRLFCKGAGSCGAGF